MKKKIELLIVLGGAVSAGAYTAGVLDYLIYMLKQWYKPDENGKIDPPYDIQIRAIVGASAGGMCAALAAKEFTTGWDVNADNKSALYETWVKKINIVDLLKIDDLEKGKVNSVFNSNVILEIANQSIKEKKGNGELPSYISDELDIILSICNTEGIHYAMNISAQNTNYPYYITDHRDYLAFLLRRKEGQKTPFKTVLEDDESWTKLAKAAVASGAFPIGLAPVKMSTPRALYEDRQIKGVEPINVDEEKNLEFFAIDGGTVDNEPFSRIQNFMKNDDENVKKLILLIDPFPSKTIKSKNSKDSTEEDEEGQPILEHIGRVFNVVRNQSLFKASELKTRLDKGEAFAITPKRIDNPDKIQVAGAAIAAFSGFIHEKYRDYDYRLGRKNCKGMLQKHFKVDKNFLENSPDGLVFSNFDDHCKIDKVDEILPIINKKDFKSVKTLLNKRIKLVMKHLADSFFIYWYLRIGRIHKLVSKYFEKELIKNELMKE